MLAISNRRSTLFPGTSNISCATAPPAKLVATAHKNKFFIFMITTFLRIIPRSRFGTFARHHIGGYWVFEPYSKANMGQRKMAQNRLRSFLHVPQSDQSLVGVDHSRSSSTSTPNNAVFCAQPRYPSARRRHHAGPHSPKSATTPNSNIATSLAVSLG